MLNAISNSMSRNVIEFNANGFDTAYDHNMSQVLELLINDMKKYYTAILSDTRENVVNESNIDSLLEFSAKSLSEKQKLFNLKYDSFNIQPVDLSINDIDTITEFLPGNNKICHFYKFDGSLKFPRCIGDVMYSLLKNFVAADKNKNEEEMRNEILGKQLLNKDFDNIVPLSFCMPMSMRNTKVDITDNGAGMKNSPMENDLEMLYNGPILNVYTHLDKDELYRVISLCIFDMFKYDYEDNINYSNFKDFYRSVAGIMLSILNKPDIRTEIFNSNLVSEFIYGAIYRSTFGSIAKFYEKIPVTGARFFIIDELKRICKTRRTSETWSNRHYSSKNYLDVIYGSRGMDYILNYTIAEILQKKLYDKVPTRESGIFEFIISNSLAYVLATASICIGDSESVKKIQEFIHIDLKESSIVDADYKYLDNAANDFSVHKNDFLDKLITIAYGAFMIKHVYDVRECVKNSNSSFSSAEYNFVTGLVASGVDYIITNLNSLNEIVHNYIPVIEIRSNSNFIEVCREEGNAESDDPEDMEKAVNPNQVFDKYKYAISRLLAITPLLRICKNFRKIRFNVYELQEKSVRNPVFGHKDNSSESLDPTAVVYSSESKNVIKSFIGNERVICSIPEYCKQLKKDMIVGVESADDSILENCIRKSLVLNSIKTKNPSPENMACINDTLNFVANKFSNIK